MTHYLCHMCGKRPGIIVIPWHLAWGLKEQPRVCLGCVMEHNGNLAGLLCERIGGFVMLSQKKAINRYLQVQL